MPDAPPKTYKAVLFNGLDKPFQLVEKEMPQPQKGQVLVKMAACPINPSDLSFLGRGDRRLKPLPLVPGFEASGTVVASGGGFLANYALGKRVGVVATQEFDGTWAEYFLTSAKTVIPLHKNVSLEQGAMSIVNPMTVYVFVELARQHKVNTVVNTAAAGQVGRMLLRWAAKKGVTVINIVRRPEQVELLKSMGAEYVLDSSQPGFEEALVELCHQLDARLAFDAVAGELASKLFTALPDSSTLYNYGNLSESPIELFNMRLVAENKVLRGFYLANWAQEQSVLRSLMVANRVQKEMALFFKSEVQARFPLSQVREALDLYQNNMTAGKVLIVPGE